MCRFWHASVVQQSELIFLSRVLAPAAPARRHSDGGAADIAAAGALRGGLGQRDSMAWPETTARLRL